MAQAYVIDAVRTAGGRRNGRLSGTHPADLGADMLDALVERNGFDPAAIEDVIFGCVTQAGEQAFAFARNAVLASKLPESVPAVTVDRQCGSSQQAVHFAAQAILSGTQDLVIAGGAESMSRVPMFSNLSYHMKEGVGIGPVSDRIASRYGRREFSQFEGAEMMARKYELNRDTLDEYALQSHRRAAQATREGVFGDEIVPVRITVEGRDEDHVVDEGIRFDASLEAIAAVKPIREGGRHSAASASQITDGASAILLASERAVSMHGLKPMARIHTLAVSAGDPVIMLEEPIHATRKVLERAGLSLADIDLYEVNEAFAAVPLAWMRALHADPAKLNSHGGAIALGHPLGATGAKLLGSLVHSLRRQGKRYGLLAICEGGGTANATIVEAL